MKIKAEDYSLLKTLMTVVFDYNRKIGETNAELLARYAAHLKVKKPAIKDGERAARWSMYRVAIVHPTEHAGKQFVGDTSALMGFEGKLSAYLNGDHLDTALRKIVKELCSNGQ